MVEFGPNGTVASQSGGTPDAGYAVETRTRFKRVWLACFLCGVGACFLVALIGVILLFLGFQIAPLFGQQADLMFDEAGVLQGMGMAVVMSAMNWYFGYFTVPAAAIMLGLSIGRFPRRGITHAMPYYRWGAIWGAILVGGTTSIATALIPGIDNRTLTMFGAALAGALVGGSAGAICGAIFRGIVRPAEQVRKIQVEVF